LVLTGEYLGSMGPVDSEKSLVGGVPTPLKNDGVKVSWDDDIPFPTVSGKSKSSHGNQSPPTRSPSYSHCCWFIAY